MAAQPVARREKSLSSFFTLSLAEEVVVAQTPLRNRDRVVLQADFAVVVEHWNTGRIVMPRIVRFLGKQHVVFAKLMDGRARIYPRRLVPKSKVTVSRNKVGAEDAPVILQAAHKQDINMRKARRR